MKTFARLAAGLCICAIASQANAWSQPTHKNIVKDALAFMNSSYATEEMRQAYRFYVSAAGSEAQAGEIDRHRLLAVPRPRLPLDALGQGQAYLARPLFGEPGGQAAEEHSQEVSETGPQNALFWPLSRRRPGYSPTRQGSTKATRGWPFFIPGLPGLSARPA